MCTLTWRREPSGYEVLFNRDERHTRLPATPPALNNCEGVRYLAPRDGDSGGSWIMANERGLTCALLNYYDAQTPKAHTPPEGWISRGHLVLSLANCTDVSAVGQRLESTALGSYRPFRIAAFDLSCGDRHWRWNGATLTHAPLHDRDRPISTSSFRSAEVYARRQEAFRRLGSSPNSKQLAAYHQSVDPMDGAFSVRMRRDDAQTVSFSRVLVDRAAVRFDYRPESRDSLELLPEERAVLTPHL